MGWQPLLVALQGSHRIVGFYGSPTFIFQYWLGYDDVWLFIDNSSH